MNDKTNSIYSTANIILDIALIIISLKNKRLDNVRLVKE